MITIKIRSNVDQIERSLNDFARKQLPFATAQTVNALAREARGAVRDEMSKVFDRPVARTLNSVRFTKATKALPESRVWIDDEPNKGIPPAKWLNAEVLGGPRRQKRFEKALQARGLMPPGTFAVPADGAPLDSSGNIPGSFLVQLLSYFNAFGEQGYRANMTDKRRRQIEKVGRSAKGYKTINGVAYFVSNGNGRNSHLPAGIYSKTGTHGSNVRPIILFVRTPSYGVRLPFFATVEKTVQRRFNAVFGAQLARAMSTGRR